MVATFRAMASAIQLLMEPILRICESGSPADWAAVKELKLSYHSAETSLCTIYPHHRNFKVTSLTATQKNHISH